VSASGLCCRAISTKSIGKLALPTSGVTITPSPLFPATVSGVARAGDLPVPATSWRPGGPLASGYSRYSLAPAGPGLLIIFLSSRRGAVAPLASGRPYDQALGTVLGSRKAAPSSQRPV
jgi:hypothetical protein